MDAPVIWTHEIAERDPNPLAIPPRPAPTETVTPISVIQFDELPNRLWTYRVTVGSAVLGFVRWSSDDAWVARDRGSATSAASIRRFTTRSAAASWLQSRVIGGQR